MGKLLFYQVFGFLIMLDQCISHSNVKVTSIESAYKKGVKAYSDESWSECIAQFEDALHLFKLRKSMLVNCRTKCNDVRYDPVVQIDVEDMKYYEKIFNIRNCLMKCKNQLQNDLHLKAELDNEIIINMNNKKPYEFLQFCYFQMNALPKAASAAYTFHVANPKDEHMRNNLQYYLVQPEVDSNEIVDMESEDYETKYELGKNSYEQSKWEETVAAMEEVISKYMTWENSCRTECQQQPHQEPSEDFVFTVSFYIASLLDCQQSCQQRVDKQHFNTGPEFLAHVLNYLQISYYNLDKVESAAKCLASYLTIYPTDEDMMANKKIYSSLIDATAFQTRSDIEYYLKRDAYEKYLLNMFHEHENSISDIEDK